MNTHEHRILNNRITLVELVIVFTGLVVAVGELTVRSLFPLSVVWIIGLGVVGGTWQYLNTEAPVIMYLYGFALPIFAMISVAHDGTLVALYAVLIFFGAILYASTVNRFGRWALGIAGAGIGVALSSTVLYAL